MLKEPGPEMRMINVGLMGFLVDWGTMGPTIIQLGFTESQHRYWLGGEVHKGNMTAVVKKRDSVFVSKRKRQIERERQRVIEESYVPESGVWWIKKERGKESWERKQFLSSLVMGNISFHHEPKLSADAYQKQWNVSLLQLSTNTNPISFSWQRQFWVIVEWGKAHFVPAQNHKFILEGVTIYTTYSTLYLSLRPMIQISGGKQLNWGWKEKTQ